jgi:hypothetical protein
MPDDVRSGNGVKAVKKMRNPDDDQLDAMKVLASEIKRMNDINNAQVEQHRSTNAIFEKNEATMERHYDQLQSNYTDLRDDFIAAKSQKERNFDAMVAQKDTSYQAMLDQKDAAYSDMIEQKDAEITILREKCEGCAKEWQKRLDDKLAQKNADIKDWKERYEAEKTENKSLKKRIDSGWSKATDIGLKIAEGLVLALAAIFGLTGMAK